MNRAVFLDRDNTIIHNDGDLGDPQAVRMIQGAASAIASLRGLGYKIVVISNQGGVARGKFTEADVDAVNQRIAETIRHNSGAVVDRFYYCPYHPEGKVRQYTREHPWRKPSPGMLEQAADDLGLDLSQCWTVGDQLRDVAAGLAAGTRTVLLRTPSGRRNASDMEAGSVEPDFVAQSLVEAVRVVAQQRRPDREAGPLPKPTSPAVAKVVAGDATKGAMRTSGRAVERGHGVEPLASVTDREVAEAEAASQVSGASAASTALDGPRGPVVVEDDAEPPGSTDYLPDEVALDPAAAEAAEDATLFTGDSDADDVEDTDADDTAEAVAEPPRAPQPVRTPLASPIKPARFEPGVPSPRQASDMASGPSADPAKEREPIVSRDQGAQIEDLLRQILRQLKRREADEGDFAMLKMGAAVMQMVALGCVFFAVYHVMGSDTGGNDVVAFFQWQLGAILAQLGVVTLLLLHWQK